MFKIRELEEKLQTLSTFTQPKILLEQYSTSPHIASRMLYVAQTQFEDIKNKKVADLGAGCGVLSLGALIVGAAFVTPFDIDINALQIYSENCKILGFPVEAICCDVTINLPGKFENFFDTVVMNPPFGTKKSAGMDIKFLEIASKLSCNVIYSLHKTTTRSFIMRKAEHFGLNCKILAELKFNLPQTYKFHKKQNVDIAVDFIRFVNKK